MGQARRRLGHKPTLSENGGEDLFENEKSAVNRNFEMQRTQIVIDKSLHNAPLGGGKGTSRAESTCATGLLVGKLKLGSQLCQIFSLAARDTSRLDQDLDPLLIEKVRCITCALTAPTSDAKEF